MNFLTALVLATTVQVGEPPETVTAPSSLDLDISAGMMQPAEAPDLAELADDPNGFFLDLSGMADFYNDSWINHDVTVTKGKKKWYPTETVDSMTDTKSVGGGFTIGLGYNFEITPTLYVSLEGEYGFHSVNSMTVVTTSYDCNYREDGKGKCKHNGKKVPLATMTMRGIDIHTLMLNVAVDQTLFGEGHNGFGVYAGAGLGAGWVDGMADFAWHGFGGARYRFNHNTMAYAGARFTDPGVVDFVSLEIGFRYSF